MRTISITLAAASCCAALATAAGAQVSSTPVDVRTNQSLLGVAVGNGVTQGQSVVSVEPKGRPMVGAGVLSGQVDHFGSKASVSALNNARLLGVDGPGGVNSARSISIRNPGQAPILGQHRR